MTEKRLKDYTRKDLRSCTILELFNAVLALVRDACIDRGYNSGKKKLYYICAEFLIGKLLSNNLINLGLFDDVKAELTEAGRDITELEEFEYEPSLGNGGLGRLSVCFLDSAAALALPADGIGIAYRCGLFKQSFEDNRQQENPDYWRKWGMSSWMRRTDRHYKVKCGDLDLISTMYEIDVTGYGSKSGRLRLFDLDSVEERLIGSGISFDKKNIAGNLTLFLYPDDSDDEGRMLRVYQEYFLVSNAAQLILDECAERGSNLHDLADYAAIQINDTHPSLIIPELVYLLTRKGIDEREALQIVTDVCAFSNHTTLSEASEKWHMYCIESAAPHLVPVIRRMNDAVTEKYSDPSVRIIDENNTVHMAHLDIHYSHSVNGVARLHTEILKTKELRNFYAIYPDRFNSKTNGITFRRWLIKCNPELAYLISRAIGESWKTDAEELKKLLPLAENPAFLQEVIDIKKKKKTEFAQWLNQTYGVIVNTDSVYDIQAKRIHLYKRPQLNLLWAVDFYLQIKAGNLPRRPVTVFFAGKAAPAYTAAKNVIHGILVFSRVVNDDPEVNSFLKVVMLPNYNVSMAEKLLPAADMSEQASLSSKEASGTGNMKLMLNGAVTIGTMDGANVEIAELVGKDNIFIFGQSSEQVIAHYEKHDYVPSEFAAGDERIRAAADFLISDRMCRAGDRNLLRQLYDELTGQDDFMALLDFRSYCEVKNKALEAYEDRMSWARKMVINIAMAGYFSSDRTISQYNDEIWHLEKDC